MMLLYAIAFTIVLHITLTSRNLVTLFGLSILEIKYCV